MGTSYYPIQMDEFVGLMEDLGFSRKSGMPGSGAYFSKQLSRTWELVVYSTIDIKTGVAIECGETAIRVFLLHWNNKGEWRPTGLPWPGKKRDGSGQKSKIWARRTRNWEEQVTRALVTGFAAWRHAPECNRGHKCAPRSGRNGYFWGCVEYPDCRAGAGSMDIDRWKDYLSSVRKAEDEDYQGLLHELVTLEPEWDEQYDIEDDVEPVEVVVPVAEADVPVVVAPTVDTTTDRPDLSVALEYKGFRYNPGQAQAIESVLQNGWVKVIGSAGGGKTATSVGMIGYMVEKANVDPRRILAISFTRKASGELRERIASVLGPLVATKVTCGTFHSVFIRWLRRIFRGNDVVTAPGGHDDYLGFRLQSVLGDDKNTRRLSSRLNSPRGILRVILGTGRATRKVRQYGQWTDVPVCDESGNPYVFGNGLDQDLDKIEIPTFEAAIGLLYSYGIRPDGDPETMREVVKRLGDDDVDRLIDLVYPLYDYAKIRLGVIDFHDMLVQFLWHVVDNPKKRDNARGMYSHVLIDEAQDNTRSQLKIAQAIAGRFLAIVGDGPQAIYSWRGADPSIFNDFHQRSDVRLVRVNVNYRSGRQIVERSDVLRKVMKDPMTSTGYLPGKKATITVASYIDPMEEVTSVSDRIFSRVEEHQQQGLGEFPFRDYGILCRTNAQVGMATVGCFVNAIPVSVPKGAAFFTQKEVEGCVAYLRAAYDYQRGFPVSGNDIASCCNIPHRGLGDAFTGPIKKWRSCALQGCFTKARESRFHTKAGDLARLIQRAAGQKGSPNTLKQAWEIIEREIMDSLLNDAGNKAGEGGSQSENLRTLSEIINRFRWDDLGRFVEMVDLANRSLRPDDDEPPNAVSISTIHRSKGLEWRVVFGIGVSTGLLPHFRSAQVEGGIDEEYRLFYVMVTRPKEELHLSWPQVYQERPQGPSPFLLGSGPGTDDCYLAPGAGLEDYLRVTGMSQPDKQ